MKFKLPVIGVMTLLVAASFGCGGGRTSGIAGGSAAGVAGGASTVGVGVTIVTPVDIPSLNINDFNFVGTNSAADLSAPASKNMSVEKRLATSLKDQFKRAAASSKVPSFAFCNQRQCLIENLRHGLDVEAFVCFMRKIAAADTAFTFVDDNKFHYATFSLSGTPAGDIGLKARLKKTGDTFKVQLCETTTNSLFEELVMKQTTVSDLDGIHATVTSQDLADPTNQGQFAVEANCKPSAFFQNAKCRFSANAKFQSANGKGNINFTASGGASVSDIVQTLEANFAAGAGTSGAPAFNVGVKSEWGAGTGATGASNVDLGSGGTFPPFTQKDFTGGDASDPIFAICPKADYYCDNPNFKESDPTSCPVVKASGATAACPIPADKEKTTDCYSIEGISIEDQLGYDLSCSDASVAVHRTAVETASTLKKNTSIEFSESWDCSDDGAAHAVDLTGIDLTECNDLLDEAAKPLAEAPCVSQDAIADGGNNEFCKGDDDKDGVLNCDDPCPEVSGASCSNDVDGDGVTDAGDNCPFKPNADQKVTKGARDSAGTAVGDACSTIAASDIDSDGIADEKDDCPFTANTIQTDTDGDKIGDPCDLYPADPKNEGFFTSDTTCTTTTSCDGDFECQLYADNHPESGLTTANAMCGSDGCCTTSQ